MSIAMQTPVNQNELPVYASRITFGRGPRVLVLPGKWQRIAAAVLIDADYTVIEADMASGAHADVTVNTNPYLAASNGAITYVPEDVTTFLEEVASHTSSSRFSHIVSL